MTDWSLILIILAGLIGIVDCLVIQLGKRKGKKIVEEIKEESNAED